MSKSEEKNLAVDPAIRELAKKSLLQTSNFFGNLQGSYPIEYSDHLKLKLHVKINDEYKRAHAKATTTKETTDGKQPVEEEYNFDKDIETITTSIQTAPVAKAKAEPSKQKKVEQPSQAEKRDRDEVEITTEGHAPGPKSEIEKMIEELPKTQQEKLSKIPKKFLIFGKKEEGIEEEKTSTALQTVEVQGGQVLPFEGPRMGTVSLAKLRRIAKPTWHAPWKLMRVISGHQGWVRCVAVDPSNQFFVTGSNDRTIMFWDLATGKRKLTLTGHISPVRGLALSSRHAYLYSCGEDKKVFCWDLEYNKIVRHYHGHLSGVYCLSLHPTLDVLATGGRDSVVRLWDARTKAQIHVLSGHQGVVSSLASQEFEPQLISGSHDHMIKLWDIGTGKSMTTLTNHKKAVRSLVIHHQEYTFASAAADNIKVLLYDSQLIFKVWKCPEGEFLRNISGHNVIINDMALNQDNVLVSCGDNGT